MHLCARRFWEVAISKQTKMDGINFDMEPLHIAFFGFEEPGLLFLL